MNRPISFPSARRFWGVRRGLSPPFFASPAFAETGTAPCSFGGADRAVVHTKGYDRRWGPGKDVRAGGATSFSRHTSHAEAPTWLVIHSGTRGRLWASRDVPSAPVTALPSRQPPAVSIRSGEGRRFSSQQSPCPTPAAEGGFELPTRGYADVMRWSSEFRARPAVAAWPLSSRPGEHREK